METLFETGRISVGRLESEEERAELRSLFGLVAIEQGWRPGADAEGRPERSVYLAALLEGRLAGGIELRLPDVSGRLPIYATWPELASCGIVHPAELVVLAVKREFRAAPGLLWTLCAEMWRFCEKGGVTDLFAAVPLQNERAYRRLGWGVERMGDVREHWGEPCLPCRIGIEAVGAAVAEKAARSPQHALAAAQARRP